MAAIPRTSSERRAVSPTDGAVGGSEKIDRNNHKRMVKRTQRAMARKTATTFGPVSAVSSAPVSIGNSIRGTKARVTNLANGARVVGRDFAFALKGTSSGITDWELVGGMPITPAVLPSSVLRNYTQMFADFKVNRLAVHYITSSPTSQAGDVLFYYERDRTSPMVDYTNNSFLPYVLSDPNTIIGPQWSNHTLSVKPTSEWKSTGFALHEDPVEETTGSVFLFSKTNATSSPGYVLIDYDISFRELCVNPRAGTLPISRGQFNNSCFGATATSFTAGNAFSVVMQGNNLSNAAAALPNGTVVGDIFKMSLCATASLINNTWTTATLSNLVRWADSNTAIVLDDGFTCYARMATTTTATFFPTAEAARTGSTPIEAQALTTATFGLIFNMSLISSIETNTQSAY